MAEHKEDIIHIQLSSLDDALSDADFSLAGACLALTCFGLTDAETVTVSSADRSVSLERDSIIQYEGSSAAMEETQ